MRAQKKHRSVMELIRHSWRNRPSIMAIIISFAKNWKTRIAALIIAFCCWGVVKTMEKTTATISIPIKMSTKKDFEAFAQTTNGLPLQEITVKILCSRRGKNALRSGDYKSKIDLTAEKENIIPSYQLSSIENIVYTGPPENKNLYFIKSITPSKIRITIDKRTFKNVPVKPNINGKPDDGYVLSKITVEPPAIMINGPSSSIDKLKELKTKIINIDGLNKTLSVNVGIEPAGPDVVMETTKVRVDVGINTAPKKRTFDHVKVKTLVSKPTGNFFLLDPSDVKVILEGRDQVIGSTVPKDITAYVDFEDATAGYSLPIKIIPPANCNVISVMPSIVTVKDNILQGTK